MLAGNLDNFLVTSLFCEKKGLGANKNLFFDHLEFMLTLVIP